MRFTYRRNKKCSYLWTAKRRLKKLMTDMPTCCIGLALSHLGRREDAEDAVQDVFTKYVGTSPRFSDDEHERAWLVRVTVNRCHDMQRRGKLRCHDSLDDISELPLAAGRK